ncbi:MULTISPECIES: flagellar export protein FliJ [unclassified Pseudoalteromonas]|jgi:flagellar FliJ protein|uniref:flagellar export protein FliJ n=1 Tax=unclassified Pseudoalteromonas TaxID=194690 RepID=UPI0007316356|nr:MULTISPECIES: flagellar export protein FliJ [unclassified Pseudoalteromonas]KTD98877.1 flagellar export protein FliJ [Pseudoalteromonas sp. H71]KTF19616.1 flagellar export protein FliJ [Pseudoalteromonas sp. 10-33]MBW4965152.1 flagellar export protein FliJ [Pseudoalteromonas sp. CR1]TMN85821.1 flagellar export protein FliJ [Pseudoalteromonas sp. S410]TMN93149.1 flagellar export protein FliJ [Pseudoalteromonas sp. S408]|tara:strand:+ start:209 stop:655 length:447 start_codon:yes stop_codon:yes gene_type:complete
MAKSKFELLLKLESEKEENLRMSYLQANQNLLANQQKLQGLNDFRLEYSQQLHLKGQSGLSSAGFGQYHAFIAKIEEAIRQQASTVNTAKQVVSQRKTLWLKQQIKAKAVAKLIENQKVKAAAIVAKNEQKMLDEFTSNQFFQRRKLS